MESNNNTDDEEDIYFPFPSLIASHPRYLTFSGSTNTLPQIYNLVDNYIQLQIDRLIIDEIANESLSSYTNEILKKNNNVVLKYENKISFDQNNCRNTKCFICMEDFVQDETLIILDCQHIYHPGCIQESVKYTTKCCLCKKPIEILK